MKIKATNFFKRNVKNLKKRFPNIIKDVNGLIDELEENPTLGISLGNGRYKIRLKNRDLNKGKSGSYRVITYLEIDDHLLLLTIYSKNSQETISDKEIDKIISEYKSNQ